jgi:hypothetical protein
LFELRPIGRYPSPLGLSVGAYLPIALKRFYRQSRIATGLKFVGIGALYSVVLIVALCAAIMASMVAT